MLIGAMIALGNATTTLEKVVGFVGAAMIIAGTVVGSAGTLLTQLKLIVVPDYGMEVA